ncbi:hypothetical protein FisN_4Hh553 [Fistulifera solaris]|uniref:DUF2470 domain-containing protein n=1 Tax=Fistulifera solaris TaxID=1519565 RepID=A0A1Z5KI29_FISSO|nr:hypothetical protein FisN_4Hh553 [Fistulifera solaris]|eukprot:GAX25963.1 hypothetical protein FisN_4Hh553 [Fistulifera solaris]
MSMDKDEISDETSKRICAHMNDDHYVSVYAMAKSLVQLQPKWKISSVNMKKVTSAGCHIQVITCSGDMCQSQNVVYNFDEAPVTQTKLRPLLIAIHHKETGPKLSWLWSKPLLLLIVSGLAFAFWGAFLSDQEQLEKNFDVFTNNIIGSSPPFQLCMALRYVLYFTALAHLFEVAFLAYFGRKHVKLSTSATIQWSLLVFFCGYPIFSEFIDFLEVLKRSKADKKK